MLPNVSWKNMVCLVLVKHQKKACLRALKSSTVSWGEKILLNNTSQTSHSRRQKTKAILTSYSTIRFVTDYKFIFTSICGRS